MTDWRDVPEVPEIAPGWLLHGWKPTRRNIDEYRRITHFRTKHQVRFVRLDRTCHEIRCEDHGSRSIMAADIGRAMEQLKDRWQRLLRLRYWDGLTQKEASGVFGVNESRSGQIERAALAALRNALE